MDAPEINVPNPEIDEDAPPFVDPDLFFLYGKDPTPGIVGMTPIFDDETYVRVFIRENGGVTHEDHKLYPFFFASYPAINELGNYDREAFKYQRLSGNNKYEYLVVFENWTLYKEALDYLHFHLGYEETWDEDEEEYRRDHREIDELYLVGSPVRQFQSQSGMTFFKGMTLDDVHRLQLDIEVYSSTDKFPDPNREGDEIIIVTITDNRGEEIIIAQDNGIKKNQVEEETGAKVCLVPTEEELLRVTKNHINMLDPDVIEGHNIFAFDFDYILGRCDLLEIPFDIGRDGSEPFVYETQRSFAERDVDYPMTSIAGRSVIDTYFLVLGYDVFAREMKSHSLKYAAKHFGVAAGTGEEDDRTYIEGAEISNYWDDDPEELLAYALDDVIETRALGEILSESPFYLSQILPMPYHDVERLGTATIIEGLFVREYLRQRMSVPEPDEGTQSEGGYTDIYVRGVIDRLIYADVSSLYPAIMLHYDCQPPESKDPVGFFKMALNRLTDMRLEVKQDMNDLKDEIEQAKKRNEEHENPDMPPPVSVDSIEKMEAQVDVLDAKQSSYKILINSFYGSLGFAIFAWNAISEADRVAETGQQLLKLMIAEIESDGGTIIEVDTDGVIFAPEDPETGEDQMGIPRDKEAEAQYVRDLTERMPDGIEIDHDGSFERMISYKKKNYALKKYDQDPEDMKIKGGSLMGRSGEAFGRAFVKSVLEDLMRGDVQSIHDTYLHYRERILQSEWDPEEFTKTESLKETFAEYNKNVEKFEELGTGHGYHTRQARFEVAIRDEEAGHSEYSIGDRVTYYVGKGRGNVADKARHVRQYDGDEDTQYYLGRLDTFAKKFKPFFSEHGFRQVFGEEDIFGFDPSGIEIKTSRVRPPLTEVETPEAPEKPSR